MMCRKSLAHRSPVRPVRCSHRVRGLKSASPEKPQKPVSKELENVLVSMLMAVSISGGGKTGFHVGKSGRKEEQFLLTLVHALKCRSPSCSQLSCQKMRLVLTHFISCGKLLEDEKCPICQQLVAVISDHAVNNCRVTDNCPVPMCDLIREPRSNDLEIKEEKKSVFT